MRKLIREALDETKFKKNIYKYIQNIIDLEDFDLETMIQNLEDMSLSYRDSVETIISFFLNNNEDPFDYFDMTDYLDLNLSYSNLYSILINDGWMDRYLFDPKYDFTEFGDIEVEGERIYLYVDNYEELKVLFKEDDVAESILKSDNLEMFDVVPDFINDIWDNLDNKSLDSIKEHILKNYVDQELENGDILTEEMINTFTLDKEFGELINEDSLFDDLKWELKNSYRNAYNTAAESELFESVHKELINLFGSEPTWLSTKVNDKTVEKLKIDITSIFQSTIVDYVEEFEELPTDSYSYFLEVLENLLSNKDDQLRIRNIDNFYPDYRNVNKYLNEYILDYI